MRFGLHIVTVGQRYHTARFDAHRACRGLRYDHAVIAQTYRALRTGGTIRVRFSRIGPSGTRFYPSGCPILQNRTTEDAEEDALDFPLNNDFAASTQLERTGCNVTILPNSLRSLSGTATS